MPRRFCRANRMRSFAGADYAYDGGGRRISQTVSSIVTRYLLDIQPGLAVVLSETAGANVTRYVHGPRGIHAQKDSANNWEWMAQDGLGSARNVVDGTANLLWSTSYDPFGTGFGVLGTAQSPYGFTGEPTLPGGLLHLRARNYHPALGIFTALDPFEGLWDAPMSINRYGYVGNNPVNRVDPSGMCWANLEVPADEQNVCYDAWVQYTNLITQTYTQSWPRDITILVSQEARYWGNLSYIDFVNGWNSSRLPASSDPGGEVLQSSLPVVGGISIANPAPGPEDLIAIGTLCIAAIWALAANAGAITLPPRPTYDFGAAGSTGATITLSTFQSMIEEASPNRGGRKFDLAFGRDPELVVFALSFGFEPITLPYFYWPDWMTTDIGRSTARQYFKASFDPILTMYFSQIPEGKLKINLSGLDSSVPHGLTTWEVWKLSTVYATKTEYYTFENLVRTQLSSVEAAPIIAEILSTFPIDLQP